MSHLKRLWNSRTDWTQKHGAMSIQNQQWRDADETELRKLTTSSSSRKMLDTSYRSHSLYSRDAMFEDADYSKNPARERSRYTSGWRFGAINCAISALLVFLINLVVMIWGSLYNKSNGGVLAEGDCERVRQLNTGIHFIINAMSTVLLSASNYCMQCLSAPTRKEIDEAHAKHIWLDIGIPSVHNLKRISSRRVLVWALLGISSLPLHLFYNSAVFSSISTNNYYAISVSQAFVDNPECSNCTDIGEKYPIKAIQAMHDKARNKELQRLSNADCITAYAKMIQSDRRNVLLVAANDKFSSLKPLDTLNSSHVYGVNVVDGRLAASSSEAVDIYQWICGEAMGAGACISGVDDIRKDAESWKVHNNPYQGPTLGTSDLDNPSLDVDYCLSERAEPHCKLQFTVPIAILVTVLNLFKAILIFYTAFGTKEDPLMTMGDAVVSFLETEDITTKGMCLLSEEDVREQKQYFPVGPRKWNGKRYQWRDVTSRRRRLTTILMFIFFLLVILVLLSYGINQLPQGQSRSLAALARLGYGAIDPRTIIDFKANLNLAQSVLIANIAQPILSFLYLSYNGLFTCMLLGYEWVTYASRRKGLRVSRAPMGEQRSTYFLQLPYRFGLPLMALSGILHWLVSQSIFLVAVDVYAWDGSRPWDSDSTMRDEGDWMSCGYSPIAILTVLILGILMVIAIIGAGFVPFAPGMNLAGSCSAAISAACHPDEWNESNGHRLAMGNLQWGVVGVNAEGVGHCTFSTKEVEMPKVGDLYAG